jgi:hypothetical protein
LTQAGYFKATIQMFTLMPLHADAIALAGAYGSYAYADDSTASLTIDSVTAHQEL